MPLHGFKKSRESPAVLQLHSHFRSIDVMFLEHQLSLVRQRHDVHVPSCSWQGGRITETLGALGVRGGSLALANSRPLAPPRRSGVDVGG